MSPVFSKAALTRFGQRADFGAIVGLVVVFAAFTIVDFHGWWSFFTMRNVTQYAAILGLVALGQTLVIMVGEIDLSVGSAYGLTAIAFIVFANTFGVPIAFVLALALAAAFGAVNAFLCVQLRLVSMIATVSTLFVGRGIIYVWTGGTADSLSHADRVLWLTQLFGGSWLALKNGFFIFILVVALAQTVLSAARFGNHLLATGGDVDTAHSRGISVARVKASAFILSAMLAGFAGILTICDQPQTHVTLGEQMELEAIAAAVLGGALLSGGRGTAIGAAIGAFTLTAVRYELVGLGAPSSWYITFLGVIVIVAVIINQRLAAAIKAI
jgi:simple sugar transport system permease protein